MDIVIIKYNAGNIGSVGNALKRLGMDAEVSDDPERIRQADRVIFPGVGEASSTMRYLRATGLDSVIPALTQPVLGICLGMQLMCAWSEEGGTPGLGIFQENVRLFQIGEKIPHMGWNSIEFKAGGLFEGIEQGSYMYFIHSYFAEAGEQTIASCLYGIRFSAALQLRNFYATQFHPEKSGEAGLKVLQNFLTV